MPTVKEPIAQEGAYQTVFEGSSDGIALVDAQGGILNVNPAFRVLVAESASQKKIPPNISFLKSTKPPESIFLKRARPFDTELLSEIGTHEDVLIEDLAGAHRLVELRVHAGLLIFRDMTAKRSIESELIEKHQELKKMQEVLVQAGKLAALGELSAGIAHELNQPLQGVRGFIQEIKDQPKLSETERQEYLKEVLTNVDRMARIIQDLRSFTRQSTKGFEKLSLKELVEHVLRIMAKPLSTSSITVELKFDASLPLVFANASQLQQVFVNLLSNAKDAIRAKNLGRGKISIEATREDKDFVSVSVVDDGIGMDAPTIQRVFDPFFTTKQAGDGMGLGLSLSLNLVQRMKGTLVAKSEVGLGSRFTLKIPVDVESRE